MFEIALLTMSSHLKIIPLEEGSNGLSIGVINHRRWSVIKRRTQTSVLMLHTHGGMVLMKINIAMALIPPAARNTEGAAICTGKDCHCLYIILMYETLLSIFRWCRMYKAVFYARSKIKYSARKFQLPIIKWFVFHNQGFVARERQRYQSLW